MIKRIFCIQKYIEKKFNIENKKIKKNFFKKNKKFKIKNFPPNPASGGIPDIDKKRITVVTDKKTFLLKILISVSVFILVKSNKNNKAKNKNNKVIYTHIFIHMMLNP